SISGAGAHSPPPPIPLPLSLLSLSLSLPQRTVNELPFFFPHLHSVFASHTVVPGIKECVAAHGTVICLRDARKPCAFLPLRWYEP
ncbi:hypothetical protein ILYODFUR_012150, partial [Ilyodon furcidens]